MNTLDKIKEAQELYQEVYTSCGVNGMNNDYVHLNTPTFFDNFSEEDWTVEMRNEGNDEYPCELVAEYEGLKFLTLLNREEYENL